MLPGRQVIRIYGQAVLAPGAVGLAGQAVDNSAGRVGVAVIVAAGMGLPGKEHGNGEYESFHGLILLSDCGQDDAGGYDLGLAGRILDHQIVPSGLVDPNDRGAVNRALAVRLACHIYFLWPKPLPSILTVDRHPHAAQRAADAGCSKLACQWSRVV